MSGYVTFEPPDLPAPSLPDASTDEHDTAAVPEAPPPPHETVPGRTQVPPEPAPAARPRAGRFVLAAAAVVALMAIVGFLLSRGGEEQAAPPAGERVSSAALELVVPRGSRTDNRASVPGLELDEQISRTVGSGAAATSVLAGVTDGKKPTLLPAPFRARLGSEPARDDTVRLGRLSAYRYADLRVEGLARPVSLYVAPTTDGVATVACVHGSPAAASHRTCGEAAASLPTRPRQTRSASAPTAATRAPSPRRCAP